MTMLPPDPLYIFKGHMQPISCITFKITSFQEFIYVGTQAGVIHVWNLKSNRETCNFKISEESCISIYVAQEDLITHDKSGVISLWKEDNNKWILQKQINTDFFGFCKFCVFEDVLYTALKDSRCQTILVKAFEQLETLDLSDGIKLGEIMAFTVTKVNNKIVMLVAYEANRIILWGLNKFEKISEFELSNCPMTIDFDVNTNRGICGDPTDQILILKLSKNMELKLEKTVKLINAGVASVRIRPDSKLVAVGCWDGKLRLYSWKTLVLLAVLETHSSTIQDVCFGKQSQGTENFKYLVAAASKDCRISLWDLYN